MLGFFGVLFVELLITDALGTTQGLPVHHHHPISHALSHVLRHGFAKLGQTTRPGLPWWLNLWLLELLGLVGCATPQLAGLQRERPSDEPAVAGIRQVPFFPQDEFQCGPAALAMVA